MCVCVSMCASIRVCVRACARVCVSACARVLAHLERSPFHTAADLAAFSHLPLGVTQPGIHLRHKRPLGRSHINSWQTPKGNVCPSAGPSCLAQCAPPVEGCLCAQLLPNSRTQTTSSHVHLHHMSTHACIQSHDPTPAPAPPHSHNHTCCLTAAAPEHPHLLPSAFSLHWRYTSYHSKSPLHLPPALGLLPLLALAPADPHKPA